MRLNKAFWILLKTKIKYLVKVKLFRAHTRMQIVADYVENPMLKYPRNSPCWCDSGRKSKHCCLPKQVGILPQEIAKQVRVLMAYKKQEHGF